MIFGWLGPTKTVNKMAKRHLRRIPWLVLTWTITRTSVSERVTYNAFGAFSEDPSVLSLDV